MRRLYRTTRSDSVFFGVCGGIGRYFGVDSTVVRVITALLVFAAACPSGSTSSRP